MTPKYIDVLIGLYERKNTSQKDNMYIMDKLKNAIITRLLIFIK